jgi:DNA (cytosine-5)-methyltransferase 1
MDFIELFAGIGGFRYGLESVNRTQNTISESNKEIEYETGKGLESTQSKGISAKKRWNEQRNNSDTNGRTFTSVYANEWDKYAGEIYGKNYGQLDLRDITTVQLEEIPDHELLTAGFPCQAFSIAGQRKGFNDTRGTLFFEIARVLQQKQPSFFILENVKGLLSHSKGETFYTILKTLDELGYDLQWQVLNSKNFGVPQNRERVFIVGNIRGIARPEIFPIRESNTATPKEFTKGVGQADRAYSPNGVSPTLPTSGGGRHEPKIAIPVLTPDREKRQEGRRFKTQGEPAFTLTGQDIHGVVVDRGEIKQRDIANTLDSNYWKGIDNHQQRTGIMHELAIRKLTPLECERLQGFPDGWTEGVSDTQRYKMLGNAVTTNVVKAIGERLL